MTTREPARERVWPTPQTVRLVHLELEYPDGAGRGVMNNFRYDMELNPSLFCLQPPAGYAVNKVHAKMPLESDLVDVLRLIAEHNNRVFGSLNLNAIANSAEAGCKSFVFLSPFDPCFALDAVAVSPDRYKQSM